MKTLEKIRYKTEHATVPHQRKLTKPNEDRLVVDEERGIFIVLDGVTRVHKEYEQTPYKSAAGKVGDIFIDEAYSYICEHISDDNPEEIMREAVRLANSKIKEYRASKSRADWEFYPSTLGIISILRDNILHYLCIGDCIGVLIRKNSRMLFGREFVLEAVDLHNVSKKNRYDIYCNHPENHLSYTVYNGDDVVMDGLEYSFIDIHEGDVVFLASDGIGAYLKYEKLSMLKNQTPSEIIEASGKYDALPYAEYADDKTLIKLTF